MIINDSKKFVFVHIPKTGGNSILRPLFDTDCPLGDVVTNDQLHQPSGVLFDWNFSHGHTAADRHTINNTRYFSFSIIRNPWDRAVSLYFWTKRLNQLYDGIRQFNSFEDFVQDIGSVLWSRPQKEYLYDAKGLVVDFVCRLESIDQDMEYVCKRLNIPTFQVRQINKNQLRPDKRYVDYYNTKTKKLIDEFYHQDIEIFRYHFGE